jgi:hypothetical protein
MTRRTECSRSHRIKNWTKNGNHIEDGIAGMYLSFDTGIDCMQELEGFAAGSKDSGRRHEADSMAIRKREEWEKTRLAGRQGLEVATC